MHGSEPAEDPPGSHTPGGERGKRRIPRITPEEAAEHARWAKPLETADPTERRRLLVDGLLRFGPRILLVLGFLAQQDRARFELLLSQAADLLLGWLAGDRLTESVEEDDRRAHAAYMVLEFAQELPPLAGLERLAALGILKLPQRHPLRDVDLARHALRRHLARVRDAGNADGELLTITDVLTFHLEPADRRLQLIEQGLAVIDQVSNTRWVRNFLVAAYFVHVELAIEARDRGHAAARGSAAGRAHEILQQIYTRSGDKPPRAMTNVMLAALQHEIEGDHRAAADAFTSIVDSGDPGHDGRVLAAANEGRLRTLLGDHPRVVTVLARIVDRFHEQYVLALTDGDIREAGRQFTEVTRNLAGAYAATGQWGEAVRVLERSKSARLRHRAALRLTPAADHLLKLESALHGAARGAPGQAATSSPARVADWIGSLVSPHPKLLEEYRRSRPQLANSLGEAPTVGEIASVLESGEAVVVLGVVSDATLIAVIVPEDTHEPSRYARRLEWDYLRLLRAFGGPREGGWLSILLGMAPDADPRPALSRMLAAMDEAIGAPLRELLTSTSARRVTVVPHLWLHALPFWALPSLAGIEVLTVPSAAHLLAARKGGPPRPAAARLLAVIDPTLDLPASPAELTSVVTHLSSIGFQVEALSREEATEPQIDCRLPGAALFHFCGHGAFDPLDATASALLVHPDPGLLAQHGAEPFRSVLKNAVWRSTGNDERWADVPGVGRVLERRAPGRGVVERRLEHSDRGTLWALYDGEEETPVRMAELWTAGDMMVQRPLDQCQMVFLSACEVGTGELLTAVDEPVGLPAALQLAGVATVVAALWPVNEALAVTAVEMFYRELASATRQTAGTVPVAAVLGRVVAALREMPREAVAALLSDVGRRTSDPGARFRLEAFAHTIGLGETRPFGHPYAWAAFFVAGAGTIRLPATSAMQ